MDQPTRKITLRLGIFGLAANVLALIAGVWPVPLIMPLVGYLATKEVFEQPNLVNYPPAFWRGAKIGMISGSIAMSPLLLLAGVGLVLLYVAKDFVFGFMDGVLSIIVPVLLLLSVISIVLSALAGGVTATRIRRKRNQQPSGAE